MQDSKRNLNKTSPQRTLLKALSIVLVGLGLQACQMSPTYLTPDQWNARTNAVNAFTNAVQAHNQGQRPTWGPATPYRAPTQSNPFIQPAQQPDNQPLFGEGSLFNQ